MKKTPTPQPNEKTKITIWLPPVLWDSIRHRSIDEHCSASQLIEKVMADYLDRQSKAAKQ